MKQISLTLVIVALFAGIAIVGCPPAIQTESPTITLTGEGAAKTALEGLVYSFTPTTDGNSYTIGKTAITDTDLFDMTGADVLDVAATGYAALDFGGDTFTLYGEPYGSVWVGQNGTLAFGTDAPAADATHANTIGIAALRTDLTGGTVTGTVAQSTFVADWADVATAADEAKTGETVNTSRFQVQGVLDSHATEADRGAIDIIFPAVDDDIDAAEVGVSSAEAGSVTTGTVATPTADAAV